MVVYKINQRRIQCLRVLLPNCKHMAYYEDLLGLFNPHQHLPLHITSHMVKATIIYLPTSKGHIQGPSGFFSVEARGLYLSIVV
jgi:hypothetical protein